MTDELELRDVVPDDLPLFFRRQADRQRGEPPAAAPSGRAGGDAFAAHWHRIQADPSIIIKTVVHRGRVVGSVMSYEESGRAEVSYWLDEQYWGQGIATRALQDFVANVNTKRPIYARAAADNAASLRVLQKCGFAANGQDREWCHEQDDDVDEIILVLDETQETRSRI